MAAITNIFGFETGDLSEATSVAGTVSVQSTVKRTGSYAMRANPTGTNSGYASLPCVQNANGTNGNAVLPVYARFYFMPASLPSAEEEFASLGNSIHYRTDSAGYLYVYQGTVLLGTSASPVFTSTSTWYRVEASVTSSTNWEVKVDGTSILSGTNGSGLSATVLFLGKFQNRNGASVDFYYDDIAIASDAFPGAGQGVMLFPRAAGNYSAWTTGTGSTFAEVDDWAGGGNDADTTYLRTAASGVQRHSLLCTTSATAGIGSSDVINAVRSIVIHRDEANANAAAMFRRSGGTDYDLTALDNPDATYTLRAVTDSTNPNGGAAWTTTTLDALEVGMAKTQSQARAMRVTAMGIYVDYTPGIVGTQTDQTFNVAAQVLKTQGQTVSTAAQVRRNDTDQSVLAAAQVRRNNVDQAIQAGAQVRATLAGTFLVAAQVFGTVSQPYDVGAQVRQNNVDKTFAVAAQVVTASATQTDRTFQTAAQVRRNDVEASYQLAAQVRQSIEAGYTVAAQVRKEQAGAYDVASQVRKNNTDQTFLVAAQVVAAGVTQTDKTFSVASQVKRNDVDAAFVAAAQVRATLEQSFAVAAQVVAAVVGQVDKTYQIASQVRKTTDQAVLTGAQVRTTLTQTFSVGAQTRDTAEGDIALAAQVRAVLSPTYQVAAQVMALDIEHTFLVAAQVVPMPGQLKAVGWAETEYVWGDTGSSTYTGTSMNSTEYMDTPSDTAYQGAGVAETEYVEADTGSVEYEGPPSVSTEYGD